MDLMSQPSVSTFFFFSKSCIVECDLHTEKYIKYGCLVVIK